jgi:hypothetical protein
MHCYFNLVSPHRTLIDEDGIAVADADEARTLARSAISEMVQEGVAEIAHWRRWEIEARDTSGAVLFTMGFEALLPAQAEGAAAQAVAEVSLDEESTCLYGKAA